MSLGPIIDVAIGLILVYLLLSLMVTAFQEILASILKMRGTMLRNAIHQLLTGGANPSPLFDKVFGHPMVAGSTANNLPAYVPSRSFALALIDTLCDGSQAPIFTQVEQQVGTLPSGAVKDALETLIRHAGGDLNALKASLATWYDDAMDRLSGIYKRRAQWIAIGCGAFFALVFNVNSVQIAEALWTNDALRAQVAASAQSFVQKNGDHPSKDAQAKFNDSMNDLFDLNLPIGWATKPAASTTAESGAKANPSSRGTLADSVRAVWDYFGSKGWVGSIAMLLGWIMTALAVSLGAPFWFDTLQQILSLRSTGPKPPTAAAANLGAKHG